MVEFFGIHYNIRWFSFLAGWLADRLIGDPEKLPHPVVAFGKVISWGERKLNNGSDRFLKGAVFAVLLMLAIYGLCDAILHVSRLLHIYLYGILSVIGVFYCLAGNTLIKEVKAVFTAVDRNVEEGRIQLSRIVGRDTSTLSVQEIRTAALETLAENLSDGVVAPMFWYILLGLPGMMTYKMLNTMDSMIGYRNERYEEFGRMAAQLDDVANYIPARLTAYMMLLVSGNWSKRSFVSQYGKEHLSPNAGYPEAALAAILDCRFGGPHDYYGESVDKPYIGENDRQILNEDMHQAVKVNNSTELVMGLIVSLLIVFMHL